MSALPLIVESSAVFGGPDHCYRYRLTRRFATGNGAVAFVMLNPSVADVMQNDPTVRRCMGYAAAWGFDTLHVLNLFALRATDPEALLAAADPVGPANDEAIGDLMSSVTMRRVVLAWGVFDLRHDMPRFNGESRSAAVRRLIERKMGPRGEIMVLRRTKTGQPAHPLYLPADLVPVPA